ncbi:hypothetical protein GGR52DRAFT_138098 [Hypoxylon sp. FL1284]|nr:hypothetical protein GGR52DRAFT_138098 [Hypoxylon sp. FL1284]
MHPLSDYASATFGALCIASAPPFVGIPFPSRAAAAYYADKNRWMSQLSGGRLTLRQAGYAGALLRLAVGACCVYPPTRVPTLLLNGAVVARGTVVAFRDAGPMMPQWGMLGAVGVCLLLELL